MGRPLLSKFLTPIDAGRRPWYNEKNKGKGSAPMLNAQQKTEIAALAAELGFAEVGFLPAGDIPYRHEFRKFCEDNLCGNYNANYSCPPTCGTPAELEARATAFQEAVVLRSQWAVTTDGEADAKAGKAAHNRWMRQFAARRRAADGKCLVMAGGCCDLCPTCLASQGLPCPHPEEVWSCLSAYCVDAAELCRLAGVDFRWCPEQISFYSVYLF